MTEVHLPEPYTQGEGDSYSFPVDDFPTPDDVVAWFVRTDGPEGFSDYWELDDIKGPLDQLVHDHDEDYECPGDSEACPLAKRISCWWIAG